MAGFMAFLGRFIGFRILNNAFYWFRMRYKLGFVFLIHFTKLPNNFYFYFVFIVAALSPTVVE